MWDLFLYNVHSLKGNSTNSTHHSVSTGLGDNQCEKSSMKSFVAEEEAAVILK